MALVLVFFVAASFTAQPRGGVVTGEGVGSGGSPGGFLAIIGVGDRVAMYIAMTLLQTPIRARIMLTAWRLALGSKLPFFPSNCSGPPFPSIVGRSTVVHGP
jgi:hypothetical protein